MPRDQLKVRGGFAALLTAFAILHPVVPAVADAARTSFSGTVLLPDGVTPAPAATVDLMLADATGAPIPGTAFARGVADLEGHFTVDLPEYDDLVAQARGGGGYLPVAVQVGKLAPHGSIDSNAGAGRLPDVALSGAITLLHLAEPSGSPAEFDLPILNGTSLGRYLEMLGLPSDFSSPFVTDAAEIVLRLADGAEEQAQVAGMFSDPDLVAGKENVDDPDLIPPLWVIVSAMVPTIDVPLAPSTEPEDVGGLGVPVGNGTDPLHLLLRPDNGETPPPCSQDPGTYWISDREGNSIEGTKTYIHVDTHSCTTDRDQSRDEVIYDWGGYAAPKDKKWTLWRVKYRTEVSEHYDYRMKKPNPIGDHDADDNSTMTWTVGWNLVAYAGVSDEYSFKSKKIHGWQYDGQGRLYHVSWISDSKQGSWTDKGFNNGGGVRLDVPQGSNGRDGVDISVYIWRCYWPNGFDYPQHTKYRSCDPRKNVDG